MSDDKRRRLSQLTFRPGTLSRWTPGGRELSRLKDQVRYWPFTIKLAGQPIRGIDGPSFYHGFREIFGNHQYQFSAATKTPRIIDGGASLGLSTLYFKKQFPEARITAFEPSPKLYQILQHNLAVFGLEDVELVQRALWNTETRLTYRADGAVGRVVPADVPESIRVQTCSLKPYLHEPVDYLKLDVEGAELNVLQDCLADLRNVQNIFVGCHAFAGAKEVVTEVTDLLHSAGFECEVQSSFRSPLEPETVGQRKGVETQFNLVGRRVASAMKMAA